MNIIPFNPIVEEEIERVLNGVSKYAMITRDELVYNTRRKENVAWRRIACYLLFFHSKIRLKNIKFGLNYSKHATVIHHRDVMKGWKDQKYAPKDLYIATVNLIYELYEKK